MVIDTSALMAILTDAPERAVFVDRIGSDSVRMLSAVSFVEVSLVVESRLGRAGGELLENFIVRAGIEIVAVDAGQARLAREAWRRFGKGRHPAALSFGDCFSYALAKSTSEPLLFKGDDFSRTDLRAA